MEIDLDINDICTELSNMRLTDDETMEVLSSIDDDFDKTDVIYRYVMREYTENRRDPPEE